jgi:hypothetical protein
MIAKVVEREGRFGLTAKAQCKEEGNRGGDPDRSGHGDPAPPVRRGGRRYPIELAGIDTGKRSDGDAGAIEVVELTAALRTVHNVVGHLALLGGGQLPVQVGRQKFSEVATRQQPSRDF